jgi:ADP-ribose pyrophosphatase YjhB (NUDIX family)
VGVGLGGGRRPFIVAGNLVACRPGCQNKRMSISQWLSWARRLQAIAQSGLTYCKDQFDIERYHQVREIAAGMMTTGSATPEDEPVEQLFARQSGYATPKVDVRVAAFRDGRILLVRELSDNCWTLPGGWADVGESPSVAAARETREESGFEVQITKLAALYDRDLHGHPPFAFHSYKAFFMAELRSGYAQPSKETSDAQFFAEDELPPLSRSRVMPAQIAHMFEHFRNPQLPTSFD